MIPEQRDMGASEGDVETLFVDNPRRFFSGG